MYFSMFNNICIFVFVLASQEEATMKRIKLEYDDIGALGRKNIEVWEMIINKEARKADDKILNQAMKQGKLLNKK